MEIDVTSENFETEVINSDIPVLVDFWATWCGPCQMMMPVVEEIANEFQNKVKVCKINTDESPELAMKFGIQSIPSFLYFKAGKLCDSRIGYIPKDKLTEMFK